MLIDHGRPIGTPPMAASGRIWGRNLASSASVRSAPKIWRKSWAPSVRRAKSPSFQPVVISDGPRPAAIDDIAFWVMAS